MNRICEFLILIVIILFLVCLVTNQESFVNQYGINPIFRPYESTVLYTTSPNNIVFDKNKFPTTVSFNPWYKPWNNGRNRFFCYLDNHLQRRCFWKCNDNNNNNCQPLEQKCC